MPKPNLNFTRIQFLAAPRQVKAIRLIAGKRNKTVSDILRELMAAFIKDNLDELRPSTHDTTGRHPE